MWHGAGIGTGLQGGIMGLGAGAFVGVDLAHACHGGLTNVRAPSALLFAGRQGEDGEACTAVLVPV